MGEKESFEGNFITGSEIFQWEIKHPCFPLMSALGVFYWNCCLLHVPTSGVMWVLSVTDKKTDKAAGKEGHLPKLSGSRCAKDRLWVPPVL